MPITQWDCPVCKHQMPLDHYTTSPCGLVIHPDYAAAVLHSNDTYYGKDLLTVTAGLGCPRSRAIEYDTGVAVNPLDYNALILGSGWDAVMERYAPEGTVKIRVEGEVAGIHLTGEIDRVRRIVCPACKGTGGSHEVDLCDHCDARGFTDLLIEDHKHSNNFQYAYLAKEDKPRIEYVIQTSIYAELYFQTFGERPTRAMVWYSFSGANQGSKPPLMSKLFDLMAVADCLAHKPYGGDYTVEQLYHQAAEYHDDGNIKIDAFALPLAGVSMSFGTKSYCDYCQVQKACMEAAQGAPF